MRTAITAALLSLAIGIGTAAAQTSSPAPSQTPQAKPTPTTNQASATDKKAISKACTDQANAKGLHGKARKKFRSECKRNGGKAQ